MKHQTKCYAYKSSIRVAINRTKTRMIKIDLFCESITSRKTDKTLLHGKFKPEDGWVEITPEQFANDLLRIGKLYVIHGLNKKKLKF